MTYLFADTIENPGHYLQDIENDSSIGLVLILMADSGHFGAEVMDSLLQGFSKPIIRGVFPEIIVEGRRKKQGVLLMPLEFDLAKSYPLGLIKLDDELIIRDPI